MATKAKTAVAGVEPLLDPTVPVTIDPTQIAAEADATATAIANQRRAILAQLAQATQIPEADLLILFGLPT